MVAERSAADRRYLIPWPNWINLRRILALLQLDARISSELIAAEVGLSATAVQRRIKKLREDGVILAQVAVLEPR